jgi:ribulose-bisphosphate carboxylase small chain
MSGIRDYSSRMDDPASRKFGTFSYLPAMDAARVRKQVEYILAKGWTPAIEHVEPARAMDVYWYLWKLPLFGETNVDAVFREIEECRRANPNHYVRLVGLDSLKQTQGAAMVVYRAGGGA